MKIPKHNETINDDDDHVTKICMKKYFRFSYLNFKFFIVLLHFLFNQLNDSIL